MMASSRPLYSPTKATILEEPISTAPMKVWLEFTWAMVLTGLQLNFDSGKGGRRRRGGGSGRGTDRGPRRRRGVESHRHGGLGPQREIDRAHRPVGMGPRGVEHPVEPGE